MSTRNRLDLQALGSQPVMPKNLPDHCQGEPVFSVMAAGWFCEKSGCIGKVEDAKLVLLKKNGFQLATILRRRIFTG
jgi:hypothetical protein